ncbi:MAG: hypothetical protein M5R36_16360 [Deltaproteobacteria bacterium]|nr:hypothetical protein [Deltaproteobacteria bacterium]
MAKKRRRGLFNRKDDVVLSYRGCLWLLLAGAAAGILVFFLWPVS